MSADKQSHRQSHKQSFVTFCECLGQLSIVGTDPAAEGCLVWRTDAQLLGETAPRIHGSLSELACDVAELYHCKRTLQLAGREGEVVVIWLEFAADGSLLVFLKPPLMGPSSAFVPGS